MLDRVDFRDDRATHALHGDAVRRDPAAGVVGGSDRRTQLGLGQRRPAAVAALVVIVGIDLDQAGAPGDLVADGADDLVDAADFLRPLRHGDARLEALRAVGAAGDDRTRRDEQARPGHDALIDRLLQPDVGIARPFRAEVALAGEAGQQRRPRLDHRARRSQRQCLVQDLIVPRRLVIGVEEKVAVALDHAGHQRRAGQVDDPRAGRRRQVRPDGSDALAVDEHLPPRVRRGVDPVEHLRRAQEDRLGHGRRGEQERGGAEGPLHGASLQAWRTANSVGR